MEIGLLALRLIVGLLFVGHGSQKLFGAFGGHGLEGTGQFMESLGMRPGRRNALAAGTAEAAGGALLAFGLVTPLAAVMIVSVMTVAVISVHAKNGIWNQDGGIEFPLVLVAVAFAVTAIGPGTASLDNALGLDLAGAGWAIAALAAGLLGGIGAILSGRAARSERPTRGAHPTAA